MKQPSLIFYFHEVQVPFPYELGQFYNTNLSLNIEEP